MTRSRRSSCSPPTSSSIATASGPTVVAGYPWFGEWSRDTMTSYEGLFLATGRAEEGRDVLLAQAATLSEGMLANTADAGGARVQHRRRHALVRARRSVVTSSARATPTSATSSRPALAIDRRAPRRRHALRHRRSTRRRPAHAGSRGLGADLDGRPRQRRPGDAARRQAGRGERVVDAHAGRGRGACRSDSDATAGRPARAQAARAFAAALRACRRRRALRRRRRAGRRRAPRSGPTSCWRSRCPDGPLAADAARSAVAVCRDAAADVDRTAVARARRSRATARTIAAGRPSATPPTTRGPSGRG